MQGTVARMAVPICVPVPVDNIGMPRDVLASVSYAVTHLVATGALHPDADGRQLVRNIARRCDGRRDAFDRVLGALQWQLWDVCVARPGQDLALMQRAIVLAWTTA